VAPIPRSRLLATDDAFALEEIDSTADILIPDDPLKRVIGQDESVRLARIAASQRRHFLLVGPPGTGKSMIAQALSLHLPAANAALKPPTTNSSLCVALIFNQARDRLPDS